jgi:hypothetical protein
MPNNTHSQQVDPKKKDGEETDQSSEAITNPEEVQESNDEKIDQDFPGYPHYPAKDDILNPENGTQRIDVDIENYTPQNGTQDINLNKNIVEPKLAESIMISNEAIEDDEIIIVAGTEADVTEEDLIILAETNGEFESNLQIQNGEEPTALTGDELDIPGAELDDANEILGEEDEENNYYSIGGDNHENLEEDKSGL